jgi:uncharacterized repeat protein (TIGR01451 family)
MNTSLIGKFRKWRVTGAIALVLILSLALSMLPAPATAYPGPGPGPDCGGGCGVMKVEIVECPGCGGDENMPCPIPVSTYFGVKAKITNYTGAVQHDVIASIDIDGTANITDCPEDWYLGTMDVGEVNTVAWTLHCLDKGRVKVKISTNLTDWDKRCTYDKCYFKQEEPPGLCVKVKSPCEVCYNCAPQGEPKSYTVNACVKNHGDVGAEYVEGTITADPEDAVNFGLQQLENVDLPASATSGVGQLAPGEKKCLSWTVTPAADHAAALTDVTFEVIFTGKEVLTGHSVTPKSDESVTSQQDVLVQVTEINPIDSCGDGDDCCCCHGWKKWGPCDEFAVVSTEQKFTVTTNVTSCVDYPALTTVNLTVPDTAILDPDSLVHIAIIDEGAVIDETDIAQSSLVEFDSLCGCCSANITWTLICTGSTDGAYVPIVVSATTDMGTWTNEKCNSACIKQEAKVHLSPGFDPDIGPVLDPSIPVELLEEDSAMKAYVKDCNTGGMVEVDHVAVGQCFDVLIAIANMGEAEAEDVSINLTITGNTDCAVCSPYNNLDLGDIKGRTIKKVWLSELIYEPMGEACCCLSEGNIKFTITAVGGTDENTCEPIKNGPYPISDNIDYICSLDIGQCGINVSILNPVQCEVVDVCSNFAVKALISNNGTCNFHDVAVTLNWNGKADLLAESPKTVTIPHVLASVDDPTTEYDESLDPRNYEVTWMMECQGWGPVELWVCVETAQGETGGKHLQIRDPGCGEECDWPCKDNLTIWQQPKGKADVEVEILSPDWGSVYATSQDFAVTASVINHERFATITIDEAYPVIDPLLEDQIAVIGGPEPGFPWIIGPGESKTVTWTLHCVDSGLSEFYIKVMGDSDVCQQVFEKTDLMLVWQYPAAHLQVQIDECPLEVVTGDSFNFSATINNTGEADATEVWATLSVTPLGSVRPCAGDQGYTKYIGTIPGHGSEASSTTVCWDLCCKVPCDSTLTVTVNGADEYGWHMKQACASTGNFLVDNGLIIAEELYTVEDPNYPSEPNKGWCYGVLIGDANGLTGPFNIDVPIASTRVDDDTTVTGRLYGYGGVVTDSHHIHWPPWASDLPNFPPEFPFMWEGHPGLQFHEGDDMILFVGYIIMDSPWDYIGSWDQYWVKDGILQVVNGMLNGSFPVKDIDCEDPFDPATCYCDMYYISLLSGTYCTNMAAEAGRAIQGRFIEPDSCTVKQLELAADLSITKEADAVDNEYVVGDLATFTVTVTNNGPSYAPSVMVEDVLPSGLNIVSATPSQGWYDVMSGKWDVGDLDVGVENAATLIIEVTVNKVGQICNRATITAAGVHDPDTTYNSALECITGLRLEVDETDNTSSWDCELGSGYNLISLPLIPEDDDPAVVLSGLNYEVAAGYYPEGNLVDGPFDYYFSAPPSPSYNTLGAIADGEGYWLVMNSAGPLTVTGYEVAEPGLSALPAYEVVGGRWNLVGFKSVVPKPAGDYLAAIAGKYTMIYGYDNATGYFIVGTYGRDYMEPCHGYWIAVQESGIIYP